MSERDTDSFIGFLFGVTPGKWLAITAMVVAVCVVIIVAITHGVIS